MSATAAAQFTCEKCDTPLSYRGGPHKPRWCEDHRPANCRSRHPAPQAIPQKRYRPVFCRSCEAQLLRKSKSGLCVFCMIESGMTEPV